MMRKKFWMIKTKIHGRGPHVRKKTEDQAKQLCVFDVFLLGLGHLHTVLDNYKRYLSKMPRCIQRELLKKTK